MKYSIVTKDKTYYAYNSAPTHYNNWVKTKIVFATDGKKYSIATYTNGKQNIFKLCYTYFVLLFLQCPCCRTLKSRVSRWETRQTVYTYRLIHQTVKPTLTPEPQPIQAESSSSKVQSKQEKSSSAKPKQKKSSSAKPKPAKKQTKPKIPKGPPTTDDDQPTHPSLKRRHKGTESTLRGDLTDFLQDDIQEKEGGSITLYIKNGE